MFGIAIDQLAPAERIHKIDRINVFVLVTPAVLTEWDAVDELVVVAGIVAAASDPEPGFPEARAAGRCIFRLFSVDDGRLAPTTLFSWAESAYTLERARNGRTYTTEIATEVSAIGGLAPRSLAAESVVADVECLDARDRNATCIEQCIARRPAAVTGDVPDSAELCGAECAAVSAEPGVWCDAVLDRVTLWFTGEVRPDGRVTFEPTGQEEARSRLDPDCLVQPAAPGELPAPLSERVETCRVRDEGGEGGRAEPLPASVR